MACRAREDVTCRFEVAILRRQEYEKIGAIAGEFVCPPVEVVTDVGRHDSVLLSESDRKVLSRLGVVTVGNVPWVIMAVDFNCQYFLTVAAGAC